MTSAWRRYKENLGTTRPWDVINAETRQVDQSTADERYEVCLGCEHLFKPTRQCKKCGCFMQIKTRLAEASCPVGKWGPVAAG